MSPRRAIPFLMFSMLFMLIYGAALNAEDAQAELARLAGNLPRKLESDKSPYLVTANIVVPIGRKVTIEDGVVMLFKPFTGLHVEGQLTAEGTKKRPIVFTSENDKKFNPNSSMYANPYDWDGLIFHESAIGSKLQNPYVQYSVYGIKSLSKYITVEDGLFLENGRANLTILDSILPVGSQPFTYRSTVQDALNDGVPIDIVINPNARKQRMVLLSSLAVIAGGGGLGAWYASQYAKDKSRFDEVNDVDGNVTGSEDPAVKYISADWQDAKSKVDKDIAYMAGGFGASLLGAVGFVWSFTF
ncbi:MAG: hypothetical protein GF398_09150 [Chitinivibrionales bacterium]|nr:hypothetical protein [Chitinivibrionales bacterium]